MAQHEIITLDFTPDEITILWLALYHFRDCGHDTQYRNGEKLAPLLESLLSGEVDKLEKGA